MTEREARNHILEEVRRYAAEFHQKKPWDGQRVPYAGRVYDEEEMVNLVDAALEFWLTAGRYTAAFEEAFARWLGVGDCVFVNSGSSANLLAFMALTSPLLGERRVCPGDEVITVAAGFPTTVAPMVQYGAVPVFVDITLPTYNVDVSALEEARTERTKAVMLAHTLGNPFDLEAVCTFCEKHGLWLIEDNCDALGALYQGRKTGTFGHLATSSFYPPHHMTTGEGGAVYTSDPLLSKILRSLRDWGRDCTCAPGEDGRCRHRFDRQYGALPLGYDHKYVYSHFGYNLKATDLQAAVGLAQLEKLPEFICLRRKHFDYLRRELSPLAEKVILPEPQKGSEPSWFGFLLTCRKKGERERAVRALEERGIQTRPLFAGNLILHPCFDRLRREKTGWRQVGELPVTNRVLEDTFWVGVAPILDEAQMYYLASCLKDVLGGGRK
ncbi:lipopolysaccharide biosynthesis protein RfbH [Anaerotignum lactatifermentans]|uniref:Lipopolysaccharide biosynthesis protein RfbH n=1 Tax=Anaerotignum lactatifermentans TaxID=160404 RepID=A0ABS2GAP7_9FIRM|nr:lipopolysaccharide biosynthesis protein RfbH [Anaerotignum lactatifermentans]MBM6828643.1 lipopolysaccharide biosynthesis protein RfbH [Anaerotignum lactatifermentans]MBM6878561.1 lipopolysaccharide biosynthesis protein RfbH [Anaerotignum lactatifermentans]MBM6950225.1 lipopolysaccharide biosynthesis protein RfbH [Anaerotignum lactatifermentans]